MQREQAERLLAQYASAGVTTDEGVLEHARMMGPTALAEAQAALESVHDGLQLEFLTDIAPKRRDALQILSDVASEYWELLEQRGVNMDGARYLGAGNNGAAWGLSDGRVLKITTDDAEAHVASHLKGKQFKHVFTVHDVWAFPGVYNGHHIYGLITEGGLVKPSLDEQNEFQAMSDVLIRVEEAMGRPIEENFRNTLRYMMADPDVTPQEKQATLLAIKKFDVVNMMAEMKKIGFATDLHSGNFMKRPDGTFVIIDIGTGGSQESAKPPFLEGSLDLEGLLHEVGVLGAPQAGPRSQLRGSNSGAWAGGRLVLANPQEHVPVDDEEESWMLDQSGHNIAGGSGSPY